MSPLQAILQQTLQTGDLTQEYASNITIIVNSVALLQESKCNTDWWCGHKQ